MQSEFQDRLGNQKSIFTNEKSIFTNDISLIIDSPMIGYIWSRAPPLYSSNSHLIYCGYLTNNLVTENKAAKINNYKSTSSFFFFHNYLI